MKFRCERDVLADALAAAGRAATGRTGTLPVLSGVRLELAGDRLVVTGTDLDLTIQLELPVGGEADGAVVMPARLASDIVRALGDPRVEVTVVRRRGRDRRRTISLLGASALARRLPAAVRRRRRTRSRCPPPSSARRCARSCGRRAPTTPVRSSPVCCWHRRATGCDSSPPTRTGWRCATSRARRCSATTRRCWSPRERCRSCSACSATRRRSPCASASARRPSRWARRA